MKLTYDPSTAKGIIAKHLYEFVKDGAVALAGSFSALELDSGAKIHSLDKMLGTISEANPKVLGGDRKKATALISKLAVNLSDLMNPAAMANLFTQEERAGPMKGLHEALASAQGGVTQLSQTMQDPNSNSPPVSEAGPAVGLFRGSNPKLLGLVKQQSAPDQSQLKAIVASQEEDDVLGAPSPRLARAESGPRATTNLNRHYSTASYLNAEAPIFQQRPIHADPHRLTKERDEARGRVEALQKELSQKTELVDSKEMELQRALEEHREMKDRLDPLAEENGNLQDKLNSIEARLGTMGAERERLRNKVKQLDPTAENSDEDAPKPMLKLTREKSQEVQALDTTIDVMQNEINKLVHEAECTERDVAVVEEARRDQGEKLKELEDAKIKQFDEITRLKDMLDQERHLRIQQGKDAEELQKKIGAQPKDATALGTPADIEYPPDETVIQNLLRAQIEFYFSNYNLKRDKPLLEKMVMETPAAKKGYLSIDEIEKLPKVRQLAPDRTTILEALKRSEYLTIAGDTPGSMVGRPNFSEPERQEFPFRRTVFVYGLPSIADEPYIRNMCSSFGQIKKIKFDAGPDTLDRHIGRRLLNKPRVKKIYSTCSMHLELKYTVKHPQNYSVFKCSWCNRQFHTAQGFYHDNLFRMLVCLQCAAKRAESQLGEFNDHRSRGIPTLSSELLGDDAKRYGLTDYRTALVVFESQRQASKCVYVRSRLGYEACFATHFHHYSKLKKEQVSTYEPAFRLMEKPAPSKDRFGRTTLGRPQLSRFHTTNPRSGPRGGPNRRRPPGLAPKSGRGMFGPLYDEHERARGDRGAPPGLDGNLQRPHPNQRWDSAPPKTLSLKRNVSAPLPIKSNYSKQPHEQRPPPRGGLSDSRSAETPGVTRLD